MTDHAFIVKTLPRSMRCGTVLSATCTGDTRKYLKGFIDFADNSLRYRDGSRIKLGRSADKAHTASLSTGSWIGKFSSQDRSMRERGHSKSKSCPRSRVQERECRVVRGICAVLVSLINVVRAIIASCARNNVIENACVRISPATRATLVDPICAGPLGGLPAKNVSRAARVFQTGQIELIQPSGVVSLLFCSKMASSVPSTLPHAVC